MKKSIHMIVMALCVVWSGELWAQTSARYLRIEAPFSQRTAYHKLDIISDGQNIGAEVAEHGSVDGVEYKGGAADFRDFWKTLLNDGFADDSRRVYFPEASPNPWTDIDLGQTYPLDKLVMRVSPSYNDRPLRVVTLLDEQRRIVHCTVLQDVFAGRARGERVAQVEVDFTTPAPLYEGKVLPRDTWMWIPLGDIAEMAEAGAFPGADEQYKLFQARNAPEAVEAFAHAFFGGMDLSKPELTPVAKAYLTGDYPAAFEAYKRRFFELIKPIENLYGHPTAKGYATQGDDLMKHAFVVPYQGKGSFIRPGRINWAETPDANHVGYTQTALLTSYAETGDARYLQRWGEISDEWGMFYSQHADRVDRDIRDYFAKAPPQQLFLFALRLKEVWTERPQLVDDLPAISLARLLVPVLDEYGPAYWRQVRQQTYNHTFNAVNAAYRSGRLLEDFYAGQRLAKEARQHMHRIRTVGMTRDGSMIEIGDEGHRNMHQVLGRTYVEMTEFKPDWFDVPYRDKFHYDYENIYRFNFRVWGSEGGNDPLYYLQTNRTTKHGMPVPHYTPAHVYQEPEVRRILDTVWGRGRNPEATADDNEVVKYLETPRYEGLPKHTSDWMAHTGLHYMRRGWARDDSYVRIKNIIRGSHSSGGGGGIDPRVPGDMMLTYWDYGSSLMAMYALQIGNHAPKWWHNQTIYPTGSKQSILTEASEKAKDARWHSGPRFSFAELFYDGAYEEFGVRRGEPGLLEEVHARRFVIMVREPRLLIIMDNANTDVDENYRFNVSLKRAEKGGRIEIDETRGIARVYGGEHPGLEARFFSASPVTFGNRLSPRGGIGWGTSPGMVDEVFSVGRRGGADHTLVGLFTPVAPGGAGLVPREFQTIQTEGLTGFRMRNADGVMMSFLTPTRQGVARMKEAGLTVEAEALLVMQTREGRSGLVLGAVDEESPHRDYEFVQDLQNPRGTQITPILRPIDSVEVHPHERVFTDYIDMELRSATPDIEIRYTVDGSDPTSDSPLYTAPVRLTENTYVKARAYRKGVTEIPFTLDATTVTPISYGRFYQRDPLPAIKPEPVTEPGLLYEYFTAPNWFYLFSHSDRIPALKTGTGVELLDVTMKEHEPFGVRYKGYLRAPEEGVYTFHAPEEFYRHIADPGYDLRVLVNDEEWDLGQEWHGRGRWSIPLEQGLHFFEVQYADSRFTPDPDTFQTYYLWRGYPGEAIRWQGEAPVLRISGPGLDEAQPIPADWLMH